MGRLRRQRRKWSSKEGRLEDDGEEKIKRTEQKG